MDSSDRYEAVADAKLVEIVAFDVVVVAGVVIVVDALTRVLRSPDAVVGPCLACPDECHPDDHYALTFDGRPAEDDQVKKRSHRTFGGGEVGQLKISIGTM